MPFSTRNLSIRDFVICGRFGVYPSQILGDNYIRDKVLISLIYKKLLKNKERINHTKEKRTGDVNRQFREK